MKKKLILMLCILGPFAKSAEIKHKFIAHDEARKQFHYIDEYKPENDWSLKYGKIKGRDLQLIGNHQVLLSQGNGYIIIDLKLKKIIKTFKGYSGVSTVRMSPDRKIYLGATIKKSLFIIILDENEKEISKIKIENPNKKFLLMRRTSQQTFIIGGWNKTIYEVDLTGKTIWEQKTDKARRGVFKGVKLKNGNILFSGGYGLFLCEMKPDGTKVKDFKAENLEKNFNINPYYYGCFTLLKNGNIVVCNWLGHGKNNSKNGKSLFEYDPKGNVVWTWQNSERAGSINTAIIIDDLDLEKFHNEINGMIEPIQ